MQNLIWQYQNLHEADKKTQKLMSITNVKNSAKLAEAQTI